MHTEKDHLCFCETPQMKLLLMFNKLTKPTKILFILKKKKNQCYRLCLISMGLWEVLRDFFKKVPLHILKFSR